MLHYEELVSIPGRHHHAIGYRNRTRPGCGNWCLADGAGPPIYLHRRAAGTRVGL